MGAGMTGGEAMAEAGGHCAAAPGSTAGSDRVDELCSGSPHRTRQTQH